MVISTSQRSFANVPVSRHRHALHYTVSIDTASRVWVRAGRRLAAASIGLFGSLLIHPPAEARHASRPSPSRRIEVGPTNESKPSPSPAAIESAINILTEWYSRSWRARVQAKGVAP